MPLPLHLQVRRQACCSPTKKALATCSFQGKPCHGVSVVFPKRSHPPLTQSYEHVLITFQIGIAAAARTSGDSSNRRQSGHSTTRAKDGSHSNQVLPMRLNKTCAVLRWKPQPKAPTSHKKALRQAGGVFITPSHELLQ